VDAHPPGFGQNLFGAAVIHFGSPRVVRHVSFPCPHGR
jgi:hypothetical protein